MTDYQIQLTKNTIGHLLPKLEEIGVAEISKDAIKKCIWVLSRKLCELNVDNANEGNYDSETNHNR